MLPLNIQFVVTIIGAFALSIGITALVRRSMLRNKILDVPNSERKIHQQPIPLGGGIAVYLALAVSVFFLYWAGWLTDDRVSGRLLVSLCIAGAVLVVGGLLDDKIRLNWYQQLSFPILATMIMIFSGLEISFVSNPIGSGLLHLNQWNIPISVLGNEWSFSPIADVLLFLWLIGMMYTTKLLDGIDGLTTSISSIAALIIFIVSLTWDRTGSTTSFLALALVGSGVGFLLWNWNPAKIFLGEGGSTFFGFMLAVLAVISGGKIATALLVMGIPILDVAWIIFRRMRTGSKLYVGDAKHLHFRLLNAGLSQRQVVIFLSLLSLLFGSVSFFFTTNGKLIALSALIIVMIVLARILVTRHEKKSLPR